MSDHIKKIIQELAKPPFEKNYNLITFDSLEHLQLLQVLTDVLAEIDPKQKTDVREEAADQTAIRIFSILRILKYKPPTDSQNMGQFRQGIVQGEKAVIYPILEWLLARIPELKQRAYLARFLVKIDVPPDFMAETDISDLFSQYEALIDEFKENHKSYETLKVSGFNTGDIKKDIASMEDEKDQLIRRVDKLKKKVEVAPNSGPMLAVARNLRTEKDREERVQKQKHDQKNQIVQLDQRIHRLQQQIKDTKQSTIGATAQGLLQKLEEETKTNQYMVKEKLPKEIALKRKAVADLSKVVSEPAMGQADLDSINDKIKECNAEVNKLVEERMVMANPADDKLSLFRQQASIIIRKKESAATALQETREELVKLEMEVQTKREQANQEEGQEVLKGEEFKKYVNKLRSKSTVYKKKRQELSELRAEGGVLARTEEILRARDETVNQQLSVVERKKGVAGCFETQDELEKVSSLKSELDNLKGRTLEDISYMVQQLNSRISAKKSSLAPIIKELRPLRERAQELKAECTQKKQVYDATHAGLESNRSKLEQEVKSLREELSAEESRFAYLSAMTRINQLHQERMAAELKAYRSADPNEKKKTMRELYSRKILEQENLGKGLREKQKYIRDSHDNNVEQMRIWKDYTRLIECKLRLVQGGAQTLGSALPAPQQHTSGTGGADVFVL